MMAYIQVSNCLLKIRTGATHRLDFGSGELLEKTEEKVSMQY